MKIPISKPFFGKEEQRAVVEPLESGWVVQGPRVAEFERRFAEYANAPNALATSSATTALHLALVAWGIGPGDEVIVPAFTWIATANVVEMVGAKPVFVDIDLDTFNASAETIERAVTSSTRAIIPVSLFGLSADIAPIMELARRRDIRVVDDAACAVGARYAGRHAGTLADAGCFSFHPRKIITTGEGGMFVTADASLAAKVRSLRDHGATTTDLARHVARGAYVLPDFEMVGYNYRMTDLQGALGVAQMARLPWLLEERRRIARAYDTALSSVSWLRTPRAPDGYEHSYQAYVCLFAPDEPTLENVARLHAGRNAVMDALERSGIATRPGSPALHASTYYRQKYGFRASDFPNAWIADRLSVSLPIYAQLTEAEQRHVIECLSAAHVA